MKVLKVIFLSLLGVAILAALAVVIITPKRLLGYLAPEIGNIRILNTKITGEKATMDLQVDVTYRLIPAFIDSVDYSLQLYQDEVAGGSKRFPDDSRSRQRQQLTIPVAIAYKELADKITKHQGDSTNLLVKVKAFCRFPLLGTHQVDLSESVRVRIPIPPEVRIVDVDVEDFGLKEMELSIQLEIENPNDFGFALRNINYHLQIDEYITSSGDFKEPLQVKANGTSRVEVPVRTELQNQLRAVFASIKGDTDWPYHLKTKLDMKPGGDNGPETIGLEMESRGTVNVFKVAKGLSEGKGKNDKTRP